ncbi:hypothetical protein [Enterococcus sp. AZ109]|uniref:hypothetical protein n=1 Tax=Enterococcus sp. AZ109 TaxID=2774634 RepID=UPI003F686E43
MTTVEMNLTDDEKKTLDELGLTDGNEIKAFLFYKINEENVLPIISSPKKTKRVSLKSNGDGSLILPDDAPEHVKEWVRHG